jgi:hypothetical protein
MRALSHHPSIKKSMMKFERSIARRSMIDDEMMMIARTATQKKTSKAGKKVHVRMFPE